MNMSGYLDRLARETHRPEAQLISQALEAGMRHLWREHVLGRYLRREITRETAIEMVGIDWVELAERQEHAVREDLAWAMETPRS